jgi:hypothetical protein
MLKTLYNSVEGLRDLWLLIDARKIENRKTLFPQQCAHLVAYLIIIANCAQLIKCAVNNNDRKMHPPPPE